MPPVRFEPKTPAGERPQSYALERAAIGDWHKMIINNILWITVIQITCSFHNDLEF